MGHCLKRPSRHCTVSRPQLATSYFGFKPKNKVIDEKIRLQIELLRDAAAVIIQKHGRRVIVKQRLTDARR